ncbi:MAG TPA: hypothetical protein VK184_03805 [Nostocaceae cyanobacterium]|nr:hypothetical protein [Nostocaceae cyanobacterium]
MKNLMAFQNLSKFFSPLLLPMQHGRNNYSVKKLTSFFPFCLIALGITANPALAQVQFAPGPIAGPNIKLNVRATAGTCPKTVGLWWLLLPYEGGGEHLVIADTREFAQTPKLISSSPQVVEFAAPLRSSYADCEGQTQLGEFEFYSMRFKDKKAYFRIDLRKIEAPAKTITYKAVLGARPYVRWAIAD